MKNDYLLDQDFLRQVDQYYQREVYAKIVSLDFDENPIVEIQGNVTQGSINVDGSSAVRRTCNLTLVTSSIQVNEIDWALRTKFRLYIGLKNFIDTDKYDDILWFKQGTFVITSFSSTLNAQGYTITLQGKDKMCLINGDLGGNVFASHDFGKIETRHADGTYTEEDFLLYDIIRDIAHIYALEPYSNIVINDLEDCAVELLDFKAKNARLYICETELASGTGATTANMYFSNSLIGQFLEENYADQLVDGLQFTYDSTNWKLIKKVEYGDTVGYRLSDLVYAGDLILSVGQPVTQVLDSIVKMLGEFEYFYDIDGRFIFQRKKIHFNIPWTNVVNTEDESYYDTIANTSSSTYVFNKGLLVESFQNKPQVNLLKNDFAIWGKRQGATTTIPMHLRYAIDHIPTIYHSVSQNRNYATERYGGLYDWRELIYQMAIDNNVYRGKLDTLLTKIKTEGVTSLEAEFGEGDYKTELTDLTNSYLATWDSGYDGYYADMLSFWRCLYSTDQKKLDLKTDRLVDMTAEEWAEWFKNGYWNPEYVTYIAEGKNKGIHFNNPETLPFWIDFIDDTSELGKYSVSMIGRRSKVVNDDAIKAIFFRDTPDILFLDPDKDVVIDNSKISYVRLNIPTAFSSYFSMSSQGKSAKEELDNLVYQHTYYQESITMSVIPIYYLEPNTRIAVEDESSGISGEYLIKSFNISLAHDGMMSITATKAENRIL